MTEHDKALALLQEAWAESVGDVSFPGLDEDLLDSDAVDSIVVVEFVQVLEDGLQIEIPDRVLVPEHVQTIRLILQTVDRLQKGEL